MKDVSLFFTICANIREAQHTLHMQISRYITYMLLNGMMRQILEDVRRGNYSMSNVHIK